MKKTEMRNMLVAIADVLTWCREHNASIRFQSNGTVSIRVNGKERRRKTLVEAWQAWVESEARR